MIKHFCNMCGKEVAGNDRFRACARCATLHIDWTDLDFCGECVKRVFGREVIDEAQAAYAERQKRIAERKARARGVEDA